MDGEKGHHYEDDRRIRQKIIEMNRLDEGKSIASFRVLYGEDKRPQIHTVTSTGLIIIKGEGSSRVITKIIARPKQIKRLYRSVGLEPPQSLLDIAESNKERGLSRV